LEIRSLEEEGPRETRPPYLPEVRERATRMVFEHRREYASPWAAIRSSPEKFGMTAETLRTRVSRPRSTMASGQDVTTAEAERIKELERKNRELRRARGVQGRVPMPTAPRADDTSGFSSSDAVTVPDPDNEAPASVRRSERSPSASRSTAATRCGSSTYCPRSRDQTLPVPMVSLE
jgi:transposase